MIHDLTPPAQEQQANISSIPCPECWNGALPGIDDTHFRCPRCGGHGTLTRRYEVRITPRLILDGYRACIYAHTEGFGHLVWMGLFETRDEAQAEADRQRVLLEGTGVRV